MQKSRSRKGNYEHEKWLIQQRICALIVFILSIILCSIEMDFTPAIFTFLVMIKVLMPENKTKEEWK